MLCTERCIHTKWTIRDPALKTFIPETNPKCPLGRKHLGEKKKSLQECKRERRGTSWYSILEQQEGQEPGQCSGSCDLIGEDRYTVGRVPFTTALTTSDLEGRQLRPYCGFWDLSFQLVGIRKGDALVSHSKKASWKKNVKQDWKRGKRPAESRSCFQHLGAHQPLLRSLEEPRGQPLQFELSQPCTSPPS